MHAGVEILKVEKLGEGTDDRGAKGRNLLFDLLDAERFRHSTQGGAYAEHRNQFLGHAFYHQLPFEFPLELFTQAEMA